jgi:hypothetical protein
MIGFRLPFLPIHAKINCLRQEKVGKTQLPRWAASQTLNLISLMIDQILSLSVSILCTQVPLMRFLKL